MAFLVAPWFRILTGVDIHPAARIGAGMRIHHGTGIVIGPRGVLGGGFTLTPGVTIWQGGATSEMPRIGEHVLIGANACGLGRSPSAATPKIGADAVVLRDAPAGRTAVGNPARLLPPKEQRTPRDLWRISRKGRAPRR